MTAKSKPHRRHRLLRVIREWPAHILTVLLIAVVLVIAPQQSSLLLYKLCLMSIGAVGGYWISSFFLRMDGECGDETDKWRLVALMAAGMIAMGMGA